MDLTCNDILCVKIAGLCHDLGHGPFSHSFQDEFVQRVLHKEWKHEESSVAMLKHLINKNNLHPSEWGLSDIDMLFVEELSK